MASAPLPSPQRGGVGPLASSGNSVSGSSTSGSAPTSPAPVTAHATIGAASHDDAGQHSLAFRVMRLARPDLRSGCTMKCEVRRKGEHALTSVVGSDEGATDWSSQLQLNHPLEASGLDGSLILPQSFGNIQLGETFSCYISLGNASEKTVTNISIRVELQTERQRRNIFENTSKPLQALEPGQRYDFIIQHDVKELGVHTLVCSTVYTESNNENVLRKYLPQWYKFNVTNPLIVRMKVRTVSEQTFVEACLENTTSEPLFLDTVKFEATPGYQLADSPRAAVDRAILDGPLNLREYLEKLVLIEPKGGSYNFIFGLEKAPPSENEDDHNHNGVAGGSSGLGKLEIRWCKAMGDSGRLQTQQIQGIVAASKKFDVKVAQIPSQVSIHSLFTAKVWICNRGETNVMSCFVVLSTYQDGSLRNVGPSGRFVKQLPINEGIYLEFNLIALHKGIHKLGPVLFLDQSGKQIAEVTSNCSVEVTTQRVAKATTAFGDLMS